MKDLRVHKVEPKSGYALLVSGILAMVVGGAMLLAGVYASAQVSSTIPRDDFTTAQNTTYEGIRDNVFDALEVGGVVVIFIGIALLIQGVRSLGA